MKVNEFECKQKIKSRNTKDKIIAAAVKLMKNHGYEYLTVRNICKVAGVTSGAFYYHFEGKVDLIGYFYVEGYKRYKRENQSRLAALNDIDRILDPYTWFASYCAYVGLDFSSHFISTENQVLNVRHPFANPSPFTPEIPNEVSRYIKDAQKKGIVNPNAIPWEMYLDMNVILFGVVLDWCLCKGSYDLIKYARRMLELYLNNFLAEQYRNESLIALKIAE